MADPICFILFFSLFFVVHSDRTLKTFTILHAPGPEALAFELTGQGPYTGTSDGRILQYQGPKIGFVDFAYTSPNRTKEKCDGIPDYTDLATTCGRTLGLGFDYRTNELYMADAYLGLYKVGPNGGLAQQLATSAKGGPFKSLDGLDVDLRTGMIYFTDLSTKYTLSDPELLGSGDSTGRLMSYNPKTKAVKVLLSGLKVPAGVAVSRDSSFVVVSEFTGNRILKYWLKGPKARTAEPILSNIPSPDNIKRTLLGDFWIATNVNIQKPEPLVIPRGVKIDGSGNILETLNVAGFFKNSSITEVQEFAGSYQIVSVVRNAIGTSKI